MYIEITSNTFYKKIICPQNTITIGFKYKSKLVINNFFNGIIKNLKCKKHTFRLPDHSKVTFYFYYSDDPTLLEIANKYKDLPLFHFQKKDITIVSKND